MLTTRNRPRSADVTQKPRIPAGVGFVSAEWCTRVGDDAKQRFQAVTDKALNSKSALASFVARHTPAIDSKRFFGFVWHKKVSPVVPVSRPESLSVTVLVLVLVSPSVSVS